MRVLTRKHTCHYAQKIFNIKLKLKTLNKKTLRTFVDILALVEGPSYLESRTTIHALMFP